MFVGMTLVCFIGMGLCMFDLTIADGFLRCSLSLLRPSVLFDRLAHPTYWHKRVTSENT